METLSVEVEHQIEQYNSEFRLLIEFLKTSKQNELVKAPRSSIDHSITQSVNWQQFIKLAESHKVAALLAHKLTGVDQSAIPNWVLPQLSRFFHANALNNQLLSLELIQTLKLLNDRGISPIPYKGAPLAVDAYNNLALRQFSDLDLLIEPDQWPEAIALLQSQGYYPTLQLDWEVHLYHPDRAITIDLHCNLVPASFALQFSVADLRARSVQISLLGQTIPHFCPEDLVLLLCTQIAKDCCHWQLRLAQICDLQALLETYPTLNWTGIFEQADRQGLRRITLLGLDLSRKLLASNLPEMATSLISQDPIVQELCQEVIAKFWAEANTEKTESLRGFWGFTQSYNHRFYWRLRERKRDRLRYCQYWAGRVCHFFFMPNAADFAALSLPRGIDFLYYPFHSIRLLLRLGMYLLSYLSSKMQRW